MEAHRVEASPRVLSRIGSVLYLIIIVFGIFGEMFVRGKLIVWGDPTATAEKILASESLWRFSVAAELFYLLCAVALPKSSMEQTDSSAHKIRLPANCC